MVGQNRLILSVLFAGFFDLDRGAGSPQNRG
jgi:hypothetical protein